RREIADGDVSRAARLLGRQFVLTGEVVSGTGTGRRFVFPTLNLAAEQSLLPRRGVYITRTLLEGETRGRRSVTNVGTRPTFNRSDLSIETHVLDWSQGLNVGAGGTCPDPVGSPPPSRSAATALQAVPFEAQGKLKHGASLPSSPKHIEVRFWERIRDEKKF